MNYKLIINEIKNSGNELLIYNKSKLIQTLQKFDMLRLGQNVFCYDTVPNEGDIWPQECQFCDDPPNPTGPTGNVPADYEFVDTYINNFECYVDFTNDVDKAKLMLINHELSNIIQTEKKFIQNFEAASSSHTSLIKQFKRKIHEYNALIFKLEATKVDYKKNIDAEYVKMPITRIQLQNKIETEITKRSINTIDAISLDNIRTQVTNELENQYSANTKQAKYEAFTAGWIAANEQIDYLAKKRDEIKKLVAPEPIPSNAKINVKQSTTIVGQTRYRIQELYTIKEALLANNANDDAVQDVINKIAELEGLNY